MDFNFLAPLLSLVSVPELYREIQFFLPYPQFLNK